MKTLVLYLLFLGAVINAGLAIYARSLSDSAYDIIKAYKIIKIMITLVLVAIVLVALVLLHIIK